MALVVIDAAGDRAFCAGADLGGMRGDESYAEVHDGRGELAGGDRPREVERVPDGARDRRGDMLAWGTVRTETAEASLLGIWRPEPPAEAGQVEAQETHATAPRKPTKARKGRKPSAGPGGAQDASQGQPGAAGDGEGQGPAVGSDG